MSHTDTVREIYAAFGRGDIPAILDRLADDVQWDVDSAAPEVPWLSPRRGRGNIGAFFESLAPLEFTTFDPHTFLENGNKVMALIHIAATHKPSGKKYEIKNEGHLWSFDDSGKVANYLHVTDTATHIALSRGE
jgi:hypothetical protein